MKFLLNSTVIEIIQGDITQSEVACIVNAANTSLLGGGGVDGAIHRAGGKQILDECIRIRNAQGNCPTGEAVITTGGKLKAKYVIHTVGPVWNDGKNNEREKLSNCYRNTLNLAVEKGIKSIAFPNISTGIYGYPKDKAAEVALKTVVEFVEKNETIERIQFVCFDRENYDIYLGGAKDTVSAKALIRWEFDPSPLPLNEWLRDLVVITGEIRGKEITEAWTVLVKVVEWIPDTWDTKAEVKFITEEAPWHLWHQGYSFKLWNGRDVATVTIQ